MVKPIKLAKDQTEFVQVDGLEKHFDASKPFLTRILNREDRQILRAVDGVSFKIPRGTTFSLVANPAVANRP